MRGGKKYVSILLFAPQVVIAVLARWRHRLRHRLRRGGAWSGRNRSRRPPSGAGGWADGCPTDGEQPYRCSRTYSRDRSFGRPQKPPSGSPRQRDCCEPLRAVPLFLALSAPIPAERWGHPLHPSWSVRVPAS